MRLVQYGCPFHLLVCFTCRYRYNGTAEVNEMEKINGSQYDEKVVKSGKPVVLKFTAPW
mgnify:CR=1 FL=1